MRISKSYPTPHFNTRKLLAASVLALSLSLGGCITKTIQHGYVVSSDQLEQIPEGSSREQVELVLGSPSTSSVTADTGGQVYYYISQKTSQTAFIDPSIVDQRVLAIYFDTNGNVVRRADYGKKDGKVFDFISRTTPTGGSDSSFIRSLVFG